MITPDQQVALLNTLMREHIAPRLPPGMGASLLLFRTRQVDEPESPGLVSYISSGSREDMRETMAGLLAKWEAEDLAREKAKPTLRPFDRHGHLMTLEAFDRRRLCDGHGVYATAEGRSIFDARGPRYPWVTHVLWFGK